MDKPPKRYKKTSFRICLLLSLFYLYYTGWQISRHNEFETQGWQISLLLGAVFLTAAILLWRRNRASDRAWEEIERKRAEADLLIREKLLAEKDDGAPQT